MYISNFLAVFDDILEFQRNSFEMMIQQSKINLCLSFTFGVT
jgi:hypothetical protein